jgi:maltooligosyltrehalose trehalohydrolase
MSHRVRSTPTNLRESASLESSVERHLEIGAEPCEAGVHFRVWAPQRRKIEVCLPAMRQTHPLHAEGNGYFSASVLHAEAGMDYVFRLDGEPGTFPDPASRFQPEGPRGPSMIVDAERFAWRDHRWQGIARQGQVLYEMHVGTFSQEGTWRGAMEQLDDLADLGITVLQIMPIAEFPGKFGWSYDPANVFAPSRLYGEPDEFRKFVDAAHQAGMGVILDVVYNHVGRVGEELLRPFSPRYFSTRHENEWGAPLNFDDVGSQDVRRFVLANVRYWITGHLARSTCCGRGAQRVAGRRKRAAARQSVAR